MKKGTNQRPRSEGLMGVRFCLISVLEQWPLFHFTDTHFFLSGPGLWPPCLEGVVHLSLERKLQWMFWCEEGWRRGLSSHPSPCPAAPRERDKVGCSRGFSELSALKVAQLTFWSLCVVHRAAGVCWPSNTWNLWCSLLTSDTSKTPWECSSLQSRRNSQCWGAAGIPPRLQELCSSPLKAPTMKTLC